MLFTSAMRHSAVAVDGETLSVYYTDVGDCPERILLATGSYVLSWRRMSRNPVGLPIFKHRRSN